MRYGFNAGRRQASPSEGSEEASQEGQVQPRIRVRRGEPEEQFPKGSSNPPPPAQRSTGRAATIKEEPQPDRESSGRGNDTGVIAARQDSPSSYSAATFISAIYNAAVLMIAALGIFRHETESNANESNSTWDSKEVKKANNEKHKTKNQQTSLSITNNDSSNKGKEEFGEEKCWEEEKAQTEGSKDNTHAITSRWGRKDWRKKEEEEIQKMIQRQTTFEEEGITKGGVNQWECETGRGRKRMRL